MLCKLLIATFALLLTACVPITPEPIQTPTVAIQPVDCEQFGSPTPSLPGTDCMAWNMVYSLVIMTYGMAKKDQLPTASELVTLETELYPLYIQAHLNCEQWNEPHKDYETFTDYLGILSFIGMEEYGYDPTSLLLYMIEGASTEEFAAMSESVGCVKNLFLLFIAYSE